ncbi:MAG: cytochrome b N-terminal domain-containing protein [Pseudolysinimonas sp.]
MTVIEKPPVLPDQPSAEIPEQSPDEQPEPFSTWTGKARRWALKILPPEKLLPESQPSYVASWIYVFGMGAIASLAVVIISGLVLSLNGPSWWHLSSLGHFVNSTHLWSVEFFFLFMVVHLWGKFWMASWRGGRVLTWITGVFSFAVSIAAAFTGYLLQTNFESQWISFEAKDALNAAGIGAWFNVANVGQMFTWHIVLLPLGVAAIVAFHVILVRIHGVVAPIDAAETDAQLAKNSETEKAR